MDATPKPLLDDYLDDAALAAELRVSIRTIWRWREMRLGPPETRPFGKKVYYHRESVLLAQGARARAGAGGRAMKPPDPGYASAAPRQEGGATRIEFTSSSGERHTRHLRESPYRRPDGRESAVGCMVAAAILRCGGSSRSRRMKWPPPKTRRPTFEVVRT